MLAKYPNLYIQFGLHAGSIVNHYTDLIPLDERIAIIWEDAGVTPYPYHPTLELTADSALAQHGLGTFEGTLSYSKKLAGFRPKSEFGLCPKGFSHLSWPLEFEHHGPFILGERPLLAAQARYEEKRMWLDNSDQLWMPCYSQAARFYREVKAATTMPMTAVALVEDAMFEHSIPLSVALYAETVWNPRQEDSRLLETATAHYYRGL